MHIPDGYLSPQTAGGLWALMIPAWYWAGHKVKNTFRSKQAPLVAISAAFTFVIMMFNVPLPGGTTGHAVGGAIVAIIIGPWAAVIAITVALVIQAIFFGDGGILALGANCFNMAFVLPITSYLVYRLISSKSSSDSPRRWLAAGIGAYIGLNLAAFLAAVEFGLQGDLFQAADGSALYSPYGLSTAIPAMMVPHLLVVGLIEGVMTSLVYIFLRRTDPYLLEGPNIKTAAGDGLKIKPLIVGLVLLLICAPIGLLATGTAWGEWGPDEIGQEIGYIPQGMERFAGFWKGVLPDYEFPQKEAVSDQGTGNSGEESEAAHVSGDGQGVAGDESDSDTKGAVSLEGVRESTPAYLVSGITGMLAASVISLLAVVLMTRSRRTQQLD